MDCTVEQVYDSVRFELGDTSAAGSSDLTNAFLAPFFTRAYEELFGRLARINAAKVRKTAYYNLPARTNILTAAQLGIQDLEQPEFLWERGGLVKVAITATSISSAITDPVVVTAEDHPFSEGAEVILSNVSPELNNRWFIHRVDADSFSLNGSYSAAAYTSGWASKSDDGFDSMDSRINLSQRELTNKLTEWVWENDAIRFIGATEERQVKIVYTASGVAPSTGTIGIDGCRNFLVTRTAQFAAGPGGQVSRAQDLKDQADSALLLLIGQAVKNLQRNLYQSPPIRRRRNRPY